MTVTDFSSATLVIGLGAARTGTAWMSDYFAKHPDILMSPLRVLHYFDVRYQREEHIRYEENFASRYERHAAKAPGGKDNKGLSALRDRVEMMEKPDGFLDYFRKRWSGEGAFADITPSYHKLRPEVFKAMRDIHPNVALLFVMRNPVDRFWSGMRLRHKKMNLRTDVYAELERFADPKRAVERQEGYTTTITNLESVVSLSSIKYLFFEEMFTRQAIDELCRFISVAPYPANVDAPLNQADPAPLSPEQRRNLYKRLEPDYRFVHERFSGRVPASWIEDMERFS